jgi:hypothetical protein
MTHPRLVGLRALMRPGCKASDVAPDAMCRSAWDALADGWMMAVVGVGLPKLPADTAQVSS